MGGGTSQYSFSSPGDYEVPLESAASWVAAPSTKFPVFKGDSFSTVTPIGKGKFGLVFLCKHHPNNKHVAVKFIPKQMIFDCQSVEKLQQEIDIVQKTNHPFIIHCFGGFQTKHCIALVFEFAYGGELYNKMKKDHKFPENVAKFYFIEIASALHYLHDEMNVVYRDLKPENILIDINGHVKLCDFGFAVPLSKQHNQSLQDGCGTAMYVAPEIAGGFMKGAHGYPVDWWSLGCVLMEMLTGTAPFGDSDQLNKFEIFNNISQKPVRFPMFMSGSVKNLVTGLLQKDPSARVSWSGVCSSDWLVGVDWKEVNAMRIKPPWIPTIKKEVNVENFVKWELLLPTENVSPPVDSYCSKIVLPKPKSTSSGWSSISPEKNGPELNQRSVKLLSSSESGRKTPSSSERVAGRQTSSRKLSHKHSETRMDRMNKDEVPPDSLEQFKKASSRHINSSNRDLTKQKSTVKRESRRNLLTDNKAGSKYNI